MPKLSSAQKTARTNERKRLVNQPVKRNIKTLVTHAESNVKSGNQAEAAEGVKKALVALDRAVNRGVLHRNNAARRKSRLMRKYNQGLASQSAAQAPSAEAK